MENIEKEINIVNNFIEQSIYHGGDSGGPYFSNEEELVEVIKIYLEYKGISDEYEIGWDRFHNIPHIEKKEITMDQIKFKKEYENRILNSTTHITEDQLIEDISDFIEYNKSNKEDNILMIAVEEMAELQQELSKIMRGKKEANRDNYSLLEELADVQICIDTIKQYSRITDDDLKYAIDTKMERIRRKIKGNEL